ncbi:hypothetical protein C7K25_00830 [Gulosibacter molinativorax]|uniref:Uncharacterized protein n=1 Tax=Gulosibacter molinativorax TaxID=256821 RepID=A0ABT7C449_9MICO|nr:hypothetical protein [Gulosibacter molinativorax]
MRVRTKVGECGVLAEAARLMRVEIVGRTLNGDLPSMDWERRFVDRFANLGEEPEVTVSMEELEREFGLQDEPVDPDALPDAN